MPAWIALVSLGLTLGCADHRGLPSEPRFGVASDAADRDGSAWSEPVNLGPIVNSNVADLGPTLSRDGLSLYFASNRAGAGIDLWVSQRACSECAWETPVNLGSVVNTPSTENRPSLSVDGHLLFFFSNRAGGEGDFDLYVSRRADPKDDFAWEAPVNLGPAVNTAEPDREPWRVQNELYFARGTILDLYVVPLNHEGEALGPAEYITELNHPAALDAGPAVRADGREIFFYSGRTGQLDLFTSTRSNAAGPWSAPVNVGSIVNSAGIEQQPSLSRDGLTLLWSSNRPGSILNPGGVPSMDIWMSTRERIRD
jgi:hypothetical protein